MLSIADGLPTFSLHSFNPFAPLSKHHWSISHPCHNPHRTHLSASEASLPEPAPWSGSRCYLWPKQDTSPFHSLATGKSKKKKHMQLISHPKSTPHPPTFNSALASAWDQVSTVSNLFTDFASSPVLPLEASGQLWDRLLPKTRRVFNGKSPYPTVAWPDDQVPRSQAASSEIKALRKRCTFQGPTVAHVETLPQRLLFLIDIQAPISNGFEGDPI